MDLWNCNSPDLFWHCQPELSQDIWREALRGALPLLKIPDNKQDIQYILNAILGEGQFGSDHWRLSFARRLYYQVKPLMPRWLIERVKEANSLTAQDGFSLGWPVEDRYARFQWEVMTQALYFSGKDQLRFRYFWPEGRRFALVLTHDVETFQGFQFIPALADLEEQLGFRSSFNIVPEKYPIDLGLLQSLRDRGFEIGVHGLKHDGSLFSSKEEFMRQAERINGYIDAWQARGFRSPLMHRHPEWLQALNLDYDLSFFDTDPYEPLPGGTMSIWPFFMGRFVELPYTLVQDSTLGIVLKETTPAIWLNKVDFIRKYHGMALLNSHPDYLRFGSLLRIYRDFLTAIKSMGDYWHALPFQVSEWWRKRYAKSTSVDDDFFPSCILSLQDGSLVVQCSSMANTGSQIEFCSN